MTLTFGDLDPAFWEVMTQGTLGAIMRSLTFKTTELEDQGQEEGEGDHLHDAV